MTVTPSILQLKENLIIIFTGKLFQLGCILQVFDEPFLNYHEQLLNFFVAAKLS